MNTCSFCSKPAICAGKEYTDRTTLGPITEDSLNDLPICVVYGCVDHNLNVYEETKKFVNNVANSLKK
jgi:hypothetical protein